MVLPRRGNTITMRLVILLPRQGNTITMRLVIGLPTRKFFGNPASQTKTDITKIKTPFWKTKTEIFGSKMKIFENQLFTKVVFCLKILYKVGICGGIVRRSGKINRRFSLMKRRVVSAKGRFVLQKSAG